MEDGMTIEQILQLEEGQTFDRKSINIAATDLASTICAFANADGGIMAQLSRQKSGIFIMN